MDSAGYIAVNIMARMKTQDEPWEDNDTKPEIEILVSIVHS